jgi:hypothetical protein
MTLAEKIFVLSLERSAENETSASGGSPQIMVESAEIALMNLN